MKAKKRLKKLEKRVAALEKRHEVDNSIKAGTAAALGRPSIPVTDVTDNPQG